MKIRHGIMSRLLHLLPPDTAQATVLRALRLGLIRTKPSPLLHNSDFSLRMCIPGVGELMHPIGLAAGFDKNAVCLPELVKLGFSFLETGTVTPLAQQSKPRPRVLRLPEQIGLIERTGWDNAGMDKVASRLQAICWNSDFIPLAVNIGKNTRTVPAGAVYDYLKGITIFKELAHFIVLCPDIEGLRSQASHDFIGAIVAETDTQVLAKVWLKLGPDMERGQFQDFVACIAKHGFGGLVLTSTHRVAYPFAGGQSGHSLTTLATTCLEWAYEVTQGELPMIASGGILTGEDVVQRIRRGASAVEIYTAFTYFGVEVVEKLLTEMITALKLLGFSSVAAAKDTHWH